MKLGSVNSRQITSAGRLDCWYHLSPGNALLRLIHTAVRRGVKTERLGGSGGLGTLWKPDRAKMCLAVLGEPSVAYLRPYDLFNYYPEAADHLSLTRTAQLGMLQLGPGQILQTCSGRNLGPSVIADKYLGEFVVGGDMIRIDIEDEDVRYYVFAFLNSNAGRNIMRRDKTGSVIDHLDPEDLEKMTIPFFSSDKVRRISQLVRDEVQLRERGRLTLQTIMQTYEAALPSAMRTNPLCTGWTVNSMTVTSRIDAAFYDPLVQGIRESLRASGGVAFDEAALVVKPPGRYKTVYVDESHGRPLLSGAQLLQTYPINLQFIHPRAFKDVTDYELHAGWIAYPADGRAEEELGTPIMITQNRNGWLASGHVGRVIPKAGVDAGWLFAAFKTTHAQLQLKSRASGSVVDSTFPSDLSAIILPPKLNIDFTKVLQVWKDFARAQHLHEQATAMVDEALAAFL